jgi:uncharacterized protein YigE (DUF2233 family)
MTVVLATIQSNEPVEPKIFGDTQVIISGLTFSGTYKTGGDSSLLPLLESLWKQQGVGIIEWVQVSGIPGFVFIYNYATNKLQVYESGKEGEAFKELAEAEYPAAIREAGKARLFAMGS